MPCFQFRVIILVQRLLFMFSISLILGTNNQVTCFQFADFNMAPANQPPRSTASAIPGSVQILIYYFSY